MNFTAFLQYCWFGLDEECWHRTGFELDKSGNIGSDCQGAVCLMWIINTEISLVELGRACLLLDRVGWYFIYASVKALEQ